MGCLGGSADGRFRPFTGEDTDGVGQWLPDRQVNTEWTDTDGYSTGTCSAEATRSGSLIVSYEVCEGTVYVLYDSKHTRCFRLLREPHQLVELDLEP